MSIICLEPYSYATRLGEISRLVGTDYVSVACRTAHVGWYGKALSVKPGIITSEFAGIIIRCDNAHFTKPRFGVEFPGEIPLPLGYE